MYSIATTQLFDREGVQRKREYESRELMYAQYDYPECQFNEHSAARQLLQ